MEKHTKPDVFSRHVEQRDYQNEAARVVRVARDFDAEAAHLWSAISQPQRLALWFLPVRGQLKLDGRFELDGNASGDIVRCDAPRALNLTWEFADNVSFVNVRLHARDAQTTVTVEHIMLRDTRSETHWSQFGPAATGIGWDLSLQALAQHIATGESANDDAAWMTSTQGKAFVKTSADAWATAHIRYGADATQARAAAARANAVYIGENLPDETINQV